MKVASGSGTMLISVGADSVTFARPGTMPGDIVGIEELKPGATATFTDAVMGYAKRQGMQLRGCPLYMSVAGAITGGALRTTSGKWFLSIDGLRAMTDISPVVTNDVVAMGWATTVGGCGSAFGGDVAAPNAANGRRCVVFVGTQGLGAACVDRSRNAVEILDSEAGHIPFSAQTDAEWELARKVAVLRGQATYENVIGFSTSEPADPQIRKTPTELDAVATIMGRYAASVTLAFAAWEGASLCGDLFERVRVAGKSAAFRSGFEGAGKMRSTLRLVPTHAAPNRTSALRGLSVLAGTNNRILPQ